MIDAGFSDYISFVFYSELLNLVFYTLVLIVGVLFAYMGYKLFAAGLFGKGKEAGDVEAKFTTWKVTLRRSAPGSFFTLCGSVLVAIALWQPGKLGTTYEGGGQPQVLGATKILWLNDDSDRILRKGLQGEQLDSHEKYVVHMIVEQLKAVPSPQSARSKAGG